MPHLTLSPFDDSAQTRLERMGITDTNGKPNSEIMPVFSGIFSAHFYEHAMDCYDNPDVVSSIAAKLSASSNSHGYKQRFVFLCLQYDAIRLPIPDPVWWIAGNADVVSEFMDAFTAHLCELASSKGADP